MISKIKKWGNSQGLWFPVKDREREKTICGHLPDIYSKKICNDIITEGYTYIRIPKQQSRKE